MSRPASSCKVNNADYVKIITPIINGLMQALAEVVRDSNALYICRSSAHNELDSVFEQWHNCLYSTRSPALLEACMPSHPKRRILQQQGNLHRRPQAVTDPLFLQHPFFDPHDLVQVKYEMLRRAQSEGHSVTQAAAAFGFSRPSFYQALAAFEHGGLGGLIAHKRGPKAAHKLTAEVVQFVRATTAGRSRATSRHAGATHRAALWGDRASAQHRARFGAQSKKTPGGGVSRGADDHRATDGALRAAAWRCR